jgi:hypothetical protein
MDDLVTGLVAVKPGLYLGFEEDQPSLYLGFLEGFACRKKPHTVLDSRSTIRTNRDF